MLINDFLIHEEQRDQRQRLRQATDLLTLLVMLRAILYTRITGDAGMKRQRLALVPVGAVGTEELLSLMSQYVVSFINEAAIYVRRGANRELRSRVANARTNAYELFSRFRLHAIAKRGADSLSFVRQEEARDFTQRVSGAIFPLLPATDAYPTLPDHIYVSGPVLLEN